MAEKKLSIRLVVRDGKVVASELEGIGRAGGEAFERIDRSSPAASISMRRLAGIAAGVFSLRSLVDVSDRYTSLANVLRVVEGEQGDVNARIEQLNDIAGRTRAPLEAVASLYQRASIAGGELGASQEDILRFTENVGLALAQQGGSAEQASGALLQLSQALGGGVVRAEEFNSILEGAYPIALAAAKGIEGAGGSVAKLRSMMLDGEVTSRMFFEAILSQTDDLEAAFSGTSATIGQALGRVRDNFTVLIGTLNGATGVSAAVARALIMVADNLARLATYAATFAAFLGARWVAAFVAAQVATMSLSGALLVLRGALIRTGIGALVVGAGELTYQFTRLVQGAGGFGAALGLLKDLALEVWERIKLGASAMVSGMGSAWQDMKAEFYWTLNDMLSGFNRFIGGVAGALNEVFDSSLGTSPLDGVLTALNAAGNDAKLVANDMARAAAAAQAAATAPLQSLQAMRDALTSAGEDGAAALDQAAAAAARLDEETRKGGAANLKKDLKDAESFASRVAQTVKSAFGSLFESIFEGGKKAGEVLLDLGKKLASMALQEAFFKMLAAAFPRTFGGSGFIPLVKAAKGNVFESGRVIPFATGGVVTRATTFPLRGATGLMGEAGPEAILPLTRIGGRLGVAAAGGGGTVVQVIDQRRGGADVETRRERGPDGREMVTMVVRDQMARGAFDRSMNGRYGAQPRAVQR